MNKYSMYVAVLVLAAIALTGCKENRHSGVQEKTHVQAESFLMSAEQFDLGLVVAKIKEGSLKNAEELAQFINTTPGVNNVDIDKDGKIDEASVVEEQADGQYTLVVRAHPVTGEPTVISEIGISKSATGVHVSGAYPQYVHGYQNHYYNHTLTGSHIGDMMFYSWLFSPRPVYYPTYHRGVYMSQPRPVLSGSQLTSTRTKTYEKTKVSPVKKQTRPSTYKPRSTATKKSVASASKKGFGDSKLGGRKGATKSYSDRGTSTKKKATGFGSTPKSTPKKSWGSSPSKKSYSSPSRPSYRSSPSYGSRKSSAEYKYDIRYLSAEERAEVASQLYSLPLAEWSYNDAIENDDRRHLGIITQDVGPGPVVTSDGKQVDLYGYTSIAIAAIQEQQRTIEVMQQEITSLRHHDTAAQICQ